MHGQNLRCDRPPSAEDWHTDLKGKLAIYRQHHAYIPDYALSFMATAARRALYVERLLATIYGCTSIRAVQALIEQSGIPRFDATIPQEATQPVAPA